MICTKLYSVANVSEGSLTGQMELGIKFCVVENEAGIQRSDVCIFCIVLHLMIVSQSSLQKFCYKRYS